ncbi:hypothetical protein AOQ84DRAFT_372860 [Glonium stellatum]|uniref:Large ribosomal subunit protein mL50 n=1 Tax=Glonium stellatum TaxID=574774 RepID=A0A8E2F935_9PEZI|nr:hypothetical protein AOQ84DRAFT_372860 [Glonium stellatum]
MPRHPWTSLVAAFSTSSSKRYAVMERNPEKSKEFTDKLRKKIWGTEDAPGREDPYSPDSPMRVPKQVNAEDESKVQESEVEEASEKEQAEWEREMEEQRAFKPARTWDGLERVGSNEWAEEFREWKRGRPHFEKMFMPAKKSTHRKEIELALHKALVEVFTLQEAGLDPVMASAGTQIQPQIEWVERVRIGLSSDKTSATLAFPDVAAKMQFLESITKSANQAQGTSEKNSAAGDLPTAGQIHIEALEGLVNESEEMITETKGTISVSQAWATATDASNATKNPSAKATKAKRLPIEDTAESNRWASGWRMISLANLKIKFAVVKRLMQLTGNRIPDPVIQNSKTVGELLDLLSVPPKPKKLAEAIQRDGNLEKVPNVKIYNRRVSPIDKEKEVGRWKVIEYALHERGLPIVGHE